MYTEIIQDAEQRMQKSVSVARDQLHKIRTGRAQPNLVEDIEIDYYGTSTPLKQLANIIAEDSRTLAIQPYDTSIIVNIEKALRISELDLNPVTQGNLIRVPLPALTEQRRQEYVKLAKNEAETGRISVRNVRRDINTEIKTYLKDKDISEDDAKRLENRVQELTNEMIQQIEKLVENKEKELLSIG